MSNIVDRLREFRRIGNYSPEDKLDPLLDEAAAEIELLLAVITTQAAEIADINTDRERLRLENWQLRQACGYSIPADKETINNPFKCGSCDAKADELAAQQQEIERLRAELEEWHHCARYDPLMSGRQFKGWDRSQMDRCRKQFLEGQYD